MVTPSLAITAGEPAGIGPDVVLMAMGTALDARIVVISDIDVLSRRADALRLDYHFEPVEPDTELAPHVPGRIPVIHTPCATPVIPGKLDSKNAASVVTMLEIAAHCAQHHHVDALVTAPVQKSIINDAGIPFSGHTEFFANHFDCKEVVMLLTNDRFKVALATTHLPLRQVPDAITEDSLIRQLTIIHESFAQFYGQPSPSIAMLGLNPHAGEAGHLGIEEIEVLIPAVYAARALGIDVSMPLPADTAFVSETVANADVVLAMFHDQGLPVLKTAGFGRSVNLTLGLPIIRTSVDHGTALALAGTGEASAGSLVAAIKEAAACAAHRAPT